MANKLFVILASDNKDVALEMALFYPVTAAKEKYLDEVKVTKELMRVLSDSRLEGEKVADFEKRVTGDMGKVLEI